MKILRFISAITIIACFMLTVACDEAELDTPILITKLTMESSNTSSVSTLTYDSNNRLIKVIEEDESTSGTDTYEIQFIYNSAGQVIEDHYIESDVSETKTKYIRTSGIIEFENYTKTEAGEWVLEDYKTVLTLNAQGLIVSNAFLYQNGDQWYSIDSAAYAWENGNMVQSTTYRPARDYKGGKLIQMLMKNPVHKCMLKDGDVDVSYENKYEYDGKKNPYGLMGLDYSYQFQCVNNVLISTHIAGNPEGEDRTVNYVYEYGDHGYPTKVTLDNPGDEFATTIYEYNK